MQCRERLEAYLRENDVPYQTQEHREAFTAQEVADSEHVPGKMVAKVVMVMADEKLVMLALPAPHVVDFGKTKGVLGVGDVRLAEEREFSAAFPDCDVGAMPPFGVLYDLPLYVDKALTEDETIVFNAGTHRDTMSVKYADYERLVKPTVAEISRKPGVARAAAGS